MRNTFVKLFLALAMCFMVCGALIACGDSAVTLTVEDGYFVVNGVKTNVKQGDRLDDCTHEIVKVEVKDHAADKDGWILEACSKCADYAKVYEGTIHEYEDGEIAATCTEAGFVGQICTICGAHGEGEEIAALGHDFVAQKAIAKALGKPACLNDAVVVSHCKVCYAVSEPEVVVGGVGHVVDAWATTNYPSNIAVGEASGKCIYCENTVTYALPVLAEANYETEWKNGVAPTCFEGAIQIFTYVAKNAMDPVTKVWDTNLEFTTEWKQPAAKHQLAGQDYTEWANANYSTEVINFYDDVNGNGTIDDGEKTGIKPFAGDKLLCDTVAPAYFECEACKEVVDVMTFVAHNGPTKVIETAYCNIAGKSETTCNECKTVIVTNPYAEHDYENGYTLTVTDWTFDKNGKKVPSKFLLEWNCPNVGIKTTVTGKDKDGKDIIKTEEVECDAHSSKELDAKLLSAGATVAPSCYDPGYTEYTYIDVDNNNKPTTIKVPGEKTAHTLNGKLVLDFAELDVATPGVKAFAGKAFDKGCEFTYEGVAYFVCSVCAEAEAAGLVESSVVDIPEIKRAHDYTEEITKAPTCKDTGLKNVKCNYKDCGDAQKDVVVEALGHDFSNVTAYVYKVANVVDTYAVNIDATCSRDCEDDDRVIDIDGKELPALSDTAYIKSTVADATCSSGAITKYTITLDLNGDPAEFELNEKDERVYATPNVTVSFDVVDNNVIPHTWNNDLVLETVVENDYNKDGIVDRIEYITFKYCKVCLAYKTFDVKYDQITEITPDWKAPEEEDAE